MSSRLTSLLSRDGIVSLSVIEQALQRQVLEGGELDTALLELGSVPENVLCAYRAASFELPPASRGQLERVGASLIARVPAELARSYRVVPVATEGDTLVLATDNPPTGASAQRLSRELGARLAFRVATELRIEVTLAEHYGIDVPSRLRLLYERLRNRDPGGLPEVQPWSLAPPPPRPSAPNPLRGSSRDQPTAPGMRRTPSSPVRVVPVVTLGAGPPAQRPSKPQEERRDTQPARPSRMPVRSTKRGTEVPRGPFTRKQALGLLGESHDRDHVLEVFSSFARQYFECTVLFAVRSERLLGLEGSGLPAALDLRRIEIPLGRGGAVDSVLTNRAPRVVSLGGNSNDKKLVEAIQRQKAQPCALVPVAVRQRIVLLLYGDRNGGSIAQAGLSDLTAVLPGMAGAFERIIHERKQLALEGRRQRRASQPPPAPESAEPQAASSAPPAPEGTFRPSSLPPRPPTPRGVAPSRVTTISGLSSSGKSGEPSPSPPPELDAPFRASAGREPPLSVAPRPARVPAEAHLLLAQDEALTERPTVTLSTEDIRTAQAASEDSAKPTQRSGSYRSHDAPPDRVRNRRRSSEATRPERPSRISAERARKRVQEMSEGFEPPADPPSPRTLSQPPPGAGSYALRTEESGPITEPLPPPAPPPAPSEPSNDEAAEKDTERPPRSSLDPRRDGGSDASGREVVSIPDAVQQSLRSPAKKAGRVDSDKFVLDLSAEADRLVSELCRIGPDEERPLVASLVRLGAIALPSLQRRFPGPLWFDRHKPRQQLPHGRDVSAIARALFAFEEQAAPYIAELLKAPQSEVRLCATLLAGDRVMPELMWPLYGRLFDHDGQVRLIAFETLPAYRNLSGFAELLKSLRDRAAKQSEPIADRLSALEAISVLRDPASVPALIELAAHRERQLSVPAHRSLVAITAQDFGDAGRKWKSWFEKNRQRHRVDWLIDGLTHAEERVRNVAGLELQKLTQVYYGFVATASKRERERAQRRYRAWWQTEGRAQFGARARKE